MTDERANLGKEIEFERQSLLERIHRWLEVPMLVLAITYAGVRQQLNLHTVMIL